MGDQKREEEFSKLAVEFINKRKDRIKFVVVCGDHTHNLEDMWSKGDLEGGQKKRIQELAAFKGIYSKLDETIPLVCVCGNHDVGNKPTGNTTQLYKDEFGDDYLSFWCGGVKFMVLNSQIVQGLSPSDELSIAHEKWADEEFRGNMRMSLCTPSLCATFRHSVGIQKRRIQISTGLNRSVRCGSRRWLKPT